MHNVLVSVTVPCYNQAQYLDECLHSVLEQKSENWECIIVNDGSTDHTEEVAKRWTEKDNRFRYLKKENGGLSSARNAGITEARGEWILPLDADDKIHPDYLYSASQHFSSGHQMIYCKAAFFGERSGPWDLPNFNLNELAKDNTIFCSSLYRKKDWERVGGYDGNFRHGLEDWDFNIKMLQNGGTVYRIPEIYFFYRIKSKSMLVDMQGGEKHTEMLVYIEKKHLAFFHQHLGTLHQLSNHCAYYQKKYNEAKQELDSIKTSKKWQLLERFANFF